MQAETQISPYLVELEGNEPIPVDLELTDVSLEHVRGDLYLLRFNGRTVSLVLRTDNRQNITLWAHNHSFKAHVMDHRDQLLSLWGVSSANAGMVNDLKAPMPGLVLKIVVSPGEKVVAGQPLVVLEAMKMENELCALADGVVSTVDTSEGQAVAKGDVLLTFAPASS